MLSEQVLTCQKSVFGIRSEPLQVAHPQDQNPQHADIFRGHDTQKPTHKLQEHDFKEEEAAANSPRAHVQRIIPPQNRKSKRQKSRAKARVFERGDLRKIVQQAGSPDVIVMLEGKIDVQKLLALPNFQQWCREQGYNHIIMSWSSNSERGGKGYAGVVVLSRVAPVTVDFGMPALVSGEARVITIEFESFNLVAVYSPCTGYNIKKIKERAHFDDILSAYISKVYINTVKPVVLAGDLNVNPRPEDYHKNAFAHMAKIKQISGLEHDPGCSPQEIAAYQDIISQFAGVNVWEKLKQYDPAGMTWHPRFNSGSRDHFLVGQRLDHFVVSEELMDDSCELQVVSIKNFQGVGSSDHCPLVIKLAKRAKTIRIDDPVIRKLIPGRTEEKGPVMTDGSTGRQKVFDAYESPVIYMQIAGEEEPAFIDSGAPFSIFNPPRDDASKDKNFLSSNTTQIESQLSIQRSGGRMYISSREFLTASESGREFKRLQVCFSRKT